MKYSLILLGIVFSYGYIIYPILLLILSLKRKKNSAINITKSQPLITFIVPVFNAENFIEKKIRNCLELSYPKDKIQFLFVSDASTDKTVSLISKYSEIKILSLDTRSGKEKALQHAIRSAKGEIVCISDVSLLLNKDSIEKIVMNFSDPLIGVVSSFDKITSNYFSMDAIHIRFEMFLRDLESKVSSSVGVSGSFFAARLSLCKSLKSTYCCSDLEISFIAVRKGLRVKLDKQLVGYYAKTNTASNEFRRQVRIITHGINTIISNMDILNPVKYGLFSWQVLSHKIVRWLVPIFSLLVIISAIFTYLINDLIYIYIIVFLASIVTILNLFYAKNPIFGMLIRYVSMFFIYIFAVFFALIKILTGEKYQTWTPTKRK